MQRLRVMQSLVKQAANECITYGVAYELQTILILLILIAGYCESLQDNVYSSAFDSCGSSYLNVVCVGIAERAGDCGT